MSSFFFFLLSPSAHSCFPSIAHTWHLLIPPCCAPTLHRRLKPTACCVNLPLPSSGFVDTGHCMCLHHFVSFFFVSFSFSFAHSFHACMSCHPTPPSALSSCVDTWASLSTLLALAASMPQPQTHYLYYRLDID